MIEIKISVRNLIEFTLRYGDINTSGYGSSPKRMEEGTRAHVKVQKRRQEENSEYAKEQYLKYQLKLDDALFTVDGRADGMVSGEFIEEIKSTYSPLGDLLEDHNELYWAQVMFYGFMHMEEKKTDNILLLLTYFNLETETERTFERQYTYEELKVFVEDTIHAYMEFVNEDAKWKLIRNESLKSLQFPFASYRLGQREMAVSVYQTIKEGKKLFAKAPTGIGKTISTLFPTLKAMGEEEVDRIFYLTSKGTQKEVAEETLNILKENEGKVKFLTLTSKEKICLNDEVNCHPDHCPYAKGHYDRINEGILEILKTQKSYSKEVIVAYGEKYQVCPFELSLDLSFFSDVIIGDYNYVFDPRVYLRRFLQDVRENYVFLVDEAHNLVDRSREMYSQVLTKDMVMEAKKSADDFIELKKPFQKINKIFLEKRKELEELEGKRSYFGVPEDLVQALQGFLVAFEIFRKAHQEDFEGKEKIMDFFFAANHFLNITDMYDEGYLTYEEVLGKNLRLKLFAIHPGEILKTICKKAKATVLFSATLLPLSYYRNLLGGEDEDYQINLPSPFPKENLQVYLDPKIDTRFRSREESLGNIAKNLYEMIQSKQGNYMAFFPSYRYMRMVYEEFVELYGEEGLYLQEQNLSENERKEILEQFHQKREGSFLAFMVLGGIFAEGIDLRGEALIGAAIIGTGYPMVSYEGDLIKNYFDDNGVGLLYAYIYPGMNRVMQAAGRVIRGEEDKGVIFLMDLRYKWKQYETMLPNEWKPVLPWH